MSSETYQPPQWCQAGAVTALKSSRSRLASTVPPLPLCGRGHAVRELGPAGSAAVPPWRGSGSCLRQAHSSLPTLPIRSTAWAPPAHPPLQGTWVASGLCAQSCPCPCVLCAAPGVWVASAPPGSLQGALPWAQRGPHLFFTPRLSSEGRPHAASVLVPGTKPPPGLCILQVRQKHAREFPGRGLTWLA